MATNAQQIRNGVIAGGIVVVVAPILSTIFGWWPAVWNAVQGLASMCLALSRLEIKLWHVLLAAAAWGMVRLARKVPPIPSKPTWRDYTEDEIDGVVWRWRYVGRTHQIADVCCFCPRDDTQMVSDERQGLFDVEAMMLCCETCNLRVGPFDGNRKAVIARIERQIDRKIRSGEWERVVAKAKEANQGG